jgi:hypothetical protein
LRVEINPEQEIPAEFKDFDSFLCHSLELAAENDIKNYCYRQFNVFKNRNRKKRKMLCPLMKFLNSIKKKNKFINISLSTYPKRDASKL